MAFSWPGVSIIVDAVTRMKLVGMLDSPYVRRVAIALRVLGLPFEHLPISVFRNLEAFERINPVMKVPTLICADGATLMDSGLILDHVEDVAGRSLWPTSPAERLAAQRVTALALAACEKSVQIVYEHELRPEDKRHGPWLERVQRQQRSAFEALDAAVAAASPAVDEASLTHAAIAAVAAWDFAQLYPYIAVGAAGCAALATFARATAKLPVFTAVPPDDRVNAGTAAP